MKELMKSVPFTVRAWTEEIPFHKTGENTYENDMYRLKVTVHTTAYPGTGAIRQSNTIENCGTEPVVLSGFSSAFIRTCRGKIGVDRNRWQAEGQWNFFTPEQCGLVPATIHPWERETYTISSVGSWSTGVFYPLTIVLGEDGYAYYMEIEGAHNWQLTHMVTGSMTAPAFALEGTAAHEENGGWHYTLLPGESYTTEPAVFGRVQGGYEEVCAELVAYKRAVSLTHHKNDTIPVVFNDYMNCLWGSPSDKKLLPLIDAAAGLETADRAKAYLAVWRIGTDTNTVRIDLTKYGYTKAQPWYPADCDCAFADGILTVRLPEKFSARMILLTK